MRCQALYGGMLAKKTFKNHFNMGFFFLLKKHVLSILKVVELNIFVETVTFFRIL